MIHFKAMTDQGDIINSALSPFTFPAGEAHTKREERRELEPTEIAVLYGSEDIHNDLFQLKMWYNASDPLENIKRVLVIPYFPGARADRGNPWGADIYAEFIGDMLFDQIILFDPHSEVIVERLEFHKWPETKITVVRPHEILDTHLTRRFMQTGDYDGIIAPDAGAENRANAVAKVWGLPLYHGHKERDFETGKLTNFSIEGLPEDGRFLVVDDICDGGGTFMGLAGAAAKSSNALLDLYVSHGVFSNKALEILPQAFGKIYTTNSYNPTRKLPVGFERIDIIHPIQEMIRLNG